VPEPLGHSRAEPSRQASANRRTTKAAAGSRACSSAYFAQCNATVAQHEREREQPTYTTSGWQALRVRTQVRHRSVRSATSSLILAGAPRRARELAIRRCM
jgi:hypothetical protein